MKEEEEVEDFRRDVVVVRRLFAGRCTTIWDVS